MVVPDADLEDAKRAQIEDIVKRKTGVAAESIVITPLSQSKEAADESASDAAGTENTEESTGDEAQDTAASADSASEKDTETSAEAQNDSTIDTEGIYD